MKKVWLCLLLIGITEVLSAQRIIEKSFKVTKDQPVLLKFDFPSVKISTWDKEEVYVKATVDINDNKQNGRFGLLDSTVDGQLTISDTIDFKHIEPEYYVEVDGEKKHFGSKEDFENYKSAHKAEKISSYSTNKTEIQIEVTVPVKDYIKLRSKFGLVEVENYTGPLTVETEFGKISAKLKASNVGKIKLTNHFGKIYSDFNMKPTEKEDRNFYTSLTASPGNGPYYDLSSKFGNIYLRNVK